MSSLEGVEGLLEGGDEVFCVLDTTRDAHEAVGDAHLVVVRLPVRVRVKGVGGSVLVAFYLEAVHP